MTTELNLQPVILGSTKFWRKLVYVKSLEELGLHVVVEKAAIPEKVKQYDAKRH